MGRGRHHDAFIGVFYTVSLGALGGFVPQIGARIEKLGIDGWELGLLLGLLALGRLVSAPLWGLLADRYRLAGWTVRVGALMSLAGMILLCHAATPTEAGFGLLTVAVGRTPLGPIVDAIVLDDVVASGRPSSAYGPLRVWGSVGFLAAAVVSGRVAETGCDPLLVALVLSAVTLVLTLGFPGRAAGRTAPIGPAISALFAQPGFLALLAFGACQALTISVYDTFFSVHVRALGLSPTVTSNAVFVGVSVEVAVMAAGRRILARVGRGRALVIAALSAIPRWILTAYLIDPTALALVQGLHGISFALFWIAGVEEVARRAEVAGAGKLDISASAQSLWAAGTYGFGALVGALGAGAIRQVWGTAAVFEACAGISVLATGFAWRGWVTSPACAPSDGPALAAPKS